MSKLTGKSSLSQVFIIIIILLISFIAYFPSLLNSFVNWDDNLYIVDNSLLNVNEWKNIGQLFSSSFEGHYHPFTLLSLAFDKLINQNDPYFFHLHNLILHLINTLLVFILCIQLNKYLKPYLVLPITFYLLPLLTSLLFTLHPANVEAVAWATARKDLLFTFYFLLSLILYLKSSGKGVYYYLSMLFFTFSILSKGQAVMLPFCLIILDYFSGKKVWSRHELVNKIPFFIIALIMGIVAVVAQQNTGYTRDQAVELSISENILYPGFAFTLYILKILLPVNLCAWYPYPESNVTALLWLCVPLFLGFIAIIIRYLRKYPLLIFGLCFFLINIFPFLKWIPVSNYIIADRYLYLSGLGIYLTITIAAILLINRRPSFRIPLLVGFLIVFILFGTTVNNRVTVWKDSLSLLNDILRKHPNVYTALNARGDVYKEMGKNEAAIADFDAAIRLRPNFARAYGNRGTLIAGMGDCEKAFTDLNKAIELDPRQPAILVNRARCLNFKGDFKEALSDLENARNLGFKHPVLEYETGIAFYNLRDIKTAITYFDRVVNIDPAYPSVYTFRGFAYFHTGNLIAAINDLNLSIAQNPDNPVTYAIRGLARIKTNDSGGCDDLQKAEKMGLIQVKNDIERYCGK